MFGPIIDGERVRLAPLTMEQLPNYVAWFSDTDVTKYLGRILPPTLEDERAWYEKTSKSDTDVVWAVLGGENRDQHIGSTGIHAIHWRSRRASTGNLIGDKRFWGQGLGSEVVKLRTRFAFEQLGLEKLETEVFVENKASRRVLEKSGYKECGVRRRHEFRHGRWLDLWLAEVLRDEWADSSCS